jgi:spermidine synthase
MFAMGVGSFLTKYVGERELLAFIRTELLLGLLGGISVPLLYFLFKHQNNTQYQFTMLALTFAIGLLTGLEIPLLTRVMKSYSPMKDNLANVLGFDYVGALAATLLFPFLLLPFVGLYSSSLLFGAVNLLLGCGVAWIFRKELSWPEKRGVYIMTTVGLIVFGLLLAWAKPFLQHWEASAYPHRVIYREQSPYQQITLTKNRDDLRLYLNRVIQFSSRDEYRYHEALALIPAGATPKVRKALILGGGEALLARELLKLPELESVTVVDLDDRVFDLARRHNRIRALNAGAMEDPRLQSLAMDAAVFLREDTNFYDLILADLPDPSSESVARLYSTWFFGMAKARLRPNGVFATQATSPFHTRKTFWAIHETLRAVGFEHLRPYNVLVPSFGVWGFIMAGGDGSPPVLRADVPRRYLTQESLDKMFYFPPDIGPPDEKILPNHLDRPVLLDYFLEEWSDWQREKTL